MYGTTTLHDGMMGIVMLYAKMGWLSRDLIDTLTYQQKVSISLGVCSGISFLHSKRVSHQYIKPENVLLFGDDPIAKLSDFGVSKIIKTVGNPKYTAPELLETGSKQGAPIDVFSLSMILFELFSGEDAFKEFTSLLQIIASISQNKRPELNNDFPMELGKLVMKGWSRVPSNRPKIEEFERALKTMNIVIVKRMSSLNLRDIKVTTLTCHDQAQEINYSSMVVPLISMKWDDSCDILLTKELRNNMIKNLKEKSKMKSMITLSVIKALEVVPRHLFMEYCRISGESFEDKLEYVYTYNKAMLATKHSNESAPEIIGAQLSLVKIETGATVLVVGGKGGYINSLVAQLVRINGRVITISANREILNECKARDDQHSPFKNTMEWKKVPNSEDLDNILNIMDADIKSIHAIIFCGATNTLPTKLSKLLSPNGGAIIASVITGPRKQQLQMFIQSEDGLQEIRHIIEFGVIFGEVKDM